jgi:DNA polymerase-3 subunit gamma/tau
VATQALYLKYRPQTFDDVIGQEHITHTLLNMVRQQRIRHAFLFSGPRGTGKTTNARLLAKAVNCIHPELNQHPCNECSVCRSISSGRFLDVIEIDAASHTGVDDVRDLRDKIAFAPSEGRYKVYIIDEVHRFSGAAFDALLKTLEEPPPHAIFVLATTEIDKVPATIKSRCLLFEFRRVSLRELVHRLEQICEIEGLKIDPRALELIARQGTGSVRDSISLLDQMVADPTEYISYELAQKMLGAAANEYVREVIEAIITGNAAYGLDMINQAIDGGADPRQFGRQVVEHLRQLLLIQVGTVALVDASDEMRQLMSEQAKRIQRGTIMNAIKVFNAAVMDMRGGWQPQLPLELAMVESLKSVQDEPIETSSRASVRATRPAPQASPTAKPSVAPETPSGERSEEFGMSSGEFVRYWKDNWDNIKDMARKLDRSLYAPLERARPLRVEGNVLVFGAIETIKATLERQGTMTSFRQLLHKMFGKGLLVRLELIDDRVTQTKAPDHLQDTVSGDDLLSFAQNELGAIISDPDES